MGSIASTRARLPTAEKESGAIGSKTMICSRGTCRRNSAINASAPSRNAALMNSMISWCSAIWMSRRTRDNVYLPIPRSRLAVWAPCMSITNRIRNVAFLRWLPFLRAIPECLAIAEAGRQLPVFWQQKTADGALFVAETLCAMKDCLTSPDAAHQPALTVAAPTRSEPPTQPAAPEAPAQLAAHERMLA